MNENENAGVMNIVRYLPQMLPLSYQEMNKQLADANYKDLQILKINIKLPANHYINWNTSIFAFQIKIKKHKGSKQFSCRYNNC